eukprot:27871-Pyramimonas_sp.AAC.1
MGKPLRFIARAVCLASPMPEQVMALFSAMLGPLDCSSWHVSARQRTMSRRGARREPIMRRDRSPIQMRWEMSPV